MLWAPNEGFAPKGQKRKKNLKRKNRRSCFYFNLFALVVFFGFKPVLAWRNRDYVTPSTLG